MRLKVFLVDDEPPALKRLARLLDDTGRVDIVGRATDPEAAIDAIAAASPDVLFLDIQMPGMTGFELLGRLEGRPMVVFTTAYDQYAIQAFEVNSIDYLLKPIEAERLERTLEKAERLRASASRPDVREIVEQLASAFRRRDQLARVPSKVGDRIQLVDLARVTHFYAKDKLTFASTAGRDYPIDHSIADLERRLDPDRFVRIHRATLVNLAYVHELDAWLGGGAVVRLKDEKRTELAVARDRVRALKEKLGVKPKDER